MNLGGGTEGVLITEIIFWVMALSTVVSAIAVVQIRDLFRSALFLIVTFLGVAGMFILLRAEFLAGVQLMIYVGAISVLIIFAILMTRDLDEGSPSHGFRIPIALTSLIFMALSIYAVSATDWNLLGSESFTDSQNEENKVVFSNSIPSIDIADLITEKGKGVSEPKKATGEYP